MCSRRFWSWRVGYLAEAWGKKKRAIKKWKGKKKTPQIHVFPERCYFLYVNNRFLKILEDEMVGWHHLLDGHKLGQTSGDSQGQGSLACGCPWGHEEEDLTWRLNNNNNSRIYVLSFSSPSPQEYKVWRTRAWSCPQEALSLHAVSRPLGWVCAPRRGLLRAHSCTDPHAPQAPGSLLCSALHSLLPSWTGSWRSEPREFEWIVQILRFCHHFMLGFSIQGAFTRFSSPPGFFSLERNVSPTKGWTHQSRWRLELV